ncbi:MAG: hypothetical protein HY314_07415 [Acidobacteria bacterium]|nr:hypothetical protein [Acidobacteriota bacterium]
MEIKARFVSSMKRAVCLILGFYALTWAWPHQAHPQQAVSIHVDGTVRHQTIMGFGGSLIPFDLDGVYRAHDPSQPERVVVPPDVRQEIARVLHTELGISRARPAPIGFEPENDNADPNVFDRSRYFWNFRSLDLRGADMYSHYITLARPFGLQSWFPSFAIELGDGEAWLRIGGAGHNRFALNPQLIDEFVEWLLAVAVHFQEIDLELPYMMIQNEPSFGTGRGVIIQPQDMAMIVEQLGRRLEQAGLRTKIVIPDDLNPTNALAYIEAVLNNPAARSFVGALAYHCYDGVYNQPQVILQTSAQGNPDHEAVAVRRRIRDLARQYHLPVWMSEISSSRPHDLTPFDVARARANHIHDELTIADATAFDLNNLFFIELPNTEADIILVYFNPDGRFNRYQVTPWGYILGHYARYARPGSVRIEATSSDPRVRVAAFERPDGGIAVVAINNNDSPVEVEIRFGGINQIPTGFEVRSSVENRLWQSSPPVEVRDGVLRVTLPPRSITTLAGA